MVTKTTQGRGRGVTRRTFLAVLGSATAVVGCASSVVGPAPVGEVQPGNVSLFAVGSLAVDSSQRPTV
jgi:hypothetical protein